MKTNNLKTITIIIGVVGVLAGLFYLSNKNKSSRPVVTDNHSHIAANVSAALLNSFIGKSAPVFSLTDRDNKMYSPETLRGKNVVLFFNEGLMCYPACWNQIASFGEDDRFKNENTIVLSVVVDSKKDWQQAIDQMPELAKATVVFDSGAAVSRQFGILTTPSSMHVGSLPGHTYVVIDKEGVIQYVFDDPNMGIRNDQLLQELKKLN